jgi:hypothetical protein
MKRPTTGKQQAQRPTSISRNGCHVQWISFAAPPREPNGRCMPRRTLSDIKPPEATPAIKVMRKPLALSFSFRTGMAG